jgi:hypothetical protein
MRHIVVQGDQPWLDNGHYWDDFFLLKVNAKYLLEELERTYVEKPTILKVCVRVLRQQRLAVGHTLPLLVASVEHDVRSMFNIRAFNTSHSTVEFLLCKRIRQRQCVTFILTICFHLDNLCSYSCDKSSQSTEWFRLSGT